MSKLYSEERNTLKVSYYKASEQDDNAEGVFIAEL